MAEKQPRTPKIINILQKLEDENINTDQLAYALVFIILALIAQAISFGFEWPIGLFIRQLLAAGCFIVGFIFVLLATKNYKNKKSAPDETPDTN